MEGSHGQVVRTVVMDGELLCKVIQRIKGVTGVKALLILAMAALDLAVMAWRIRTDQLMSDTKHCYNLSKVPACQTVF